MKNLAGVVALLTCVLLSSAAQAQSGKVKLPRRRVLEQGVKLQRDSGSGELHALPSTAPPTGDVRGDGVIRSRVTMVQVGCTVTAPDGTQVRGLGRADFTLREDDAAQEIASFDSAETPASIALLFDASPSISREQREMRDAAQSLSQSLAPADEVAVAAFADRTLLLTPFRVTVICWLRRWPLRISTTLPILLNRASTRRCTSPRESYSPIAPDAKRLCC